MQSSNATLIKFRVQINKALKNKNFYVINLKNVLSVTEAGVRRSVVGKSCSEYIRVSLGKYFRWDLFLIKVVDLMSPALLK